MTFGVDVDSGQDHKCCSTHKLKNRYSIQKSKLLGWGIFLDLQKKGNKLGELILCGMGNELQGMLWHAGNLSYHC